MCSFFKIISLNFLASTSTPAPSQNCRCGIQGDDTTRSANNNRIIGGTKINPVKTIFSLDIIYVRSIRDTFILHTFTYKMFVYLFLNQLLSLIQLCFCPCPYTSMKCAHLPRQSVILTILN